MSKLKYEAIIEEFTPKIKKSLNNTSPQEREDLEQEIKLKIYEKLKILQSISSPSFFEFIEEKMNISDRNLDM